MIPPETIQRVADASDIVAVIGEYLPLQKTGATFVSLCPFHPEKTPSFTVTPARQRFKCFGCGASGDVFGFVAMAESTSFPLAVHNLAVRAGIPILDDLDPRGVKRSIGIPMDRPRGRRPVQQKPARFVAPPEPLRLPADLHQGSRDELRAVAALRGLSLAGMELADERGLMQFGSVCHSPCWIVTDSTQTVAQARRIDGLPFPAFGALGMRKAHTLKSSRSAWPIGTKEIGDKPFVVVCEGGPDLLAACYFIDAEDRERDVAPVTLLGGTNDIPEAALLLLAHKRVRLFPHADPAGQASAVRWAAQLERVGCDVDAFSFGGLHRSDGWPVKDLNDFALLDADCFESERIDLERILPR